MLVQPQSQTYTLDEYRALEETAEFRTEYHDRKIIPMSGGTIEHNNIIINLIVMFTMALRGTNYHVQSKHCFLFLLRPHSGISDRILASSSIRRSLK